MQECAGRHESGTYDRIQLSGVHGRIKNGVYMGILKVGYLHMRSDTDEEPTYMKYSVSFVCCGKRAIY